MIRFFANDHEAHSAAARNLIRMASTGAMVLVVPFTAISETVFTLRKLYKHSRHETVKQMQRLLSAKGIKTAAPSWISDALEEYAKSVVSFGDACIAAEARHLGLAVATFDSDFDSLPGIVRLNPLAVESGHV
ncbi:MAG: PIN domain-containing protein [Verrucomicrobiaceae bacterium]|nr:PIN domain-containing protein [Verrucomicrobiaceae bacterium]